jgi:hypothetical protein
VEHERAVGEVVELGFVVALGARAGLDALGVKPPVDRVRADFTGMQLGPELREADVVLPAAERAGPMPGGEGGRLVEEEELREAPGLQERTALPAAELESASDPALAVVASADPAGVVVKAATVPVDQTARGVCDQLAQRCDPVLQRHPRDHRERGIAAETWNN